MEYVRTLQQCRHSRYVILCCIPERAGADCTLMMLPPSSPSLPHVLLISIYCRSISHLLLGFNTTFTFRFSIPCMFDSCWPPMVHCHLYISLTATNFTVTFSPPSQSHSLHLHKHTLPTFTVTVTAFSQCVLHVTYSRTLSASCCSSFPVSWWSMQPLTSMTPTTSEIP